MESSVLTMNKNTLKAEVKRWLKDMLGEPPRSLAIQWNDLLDGCVCDLIDGGIIMLYIKSPEDWEIRVIRIFK